MRIGCDLVDSSRLVSPSPSFLSGVLSPKEKEEYDTRANKAEFLAGHYAAKEAFVKATGVGLSLAPLNKIMVLYEKSGAPYIHFEDKDYPCSISHDGGYAMGVVIIP